MDKMKVVKSFRDYMGHCIIIDEVIDTLFESIVSRPDDSEYVESKGTSITTYHSGDIKTEIVRSYTRDELRYGVMKYTKGGIEYTLAIKYITHIEISNNHGYQKLTDGSMKIGDLYSVSSMKVDLSNRSITDYVYLSMLDMSIYKGTTMGNGHKPVAVANMSDDYTITEI